MSDLAGVQTNTVAENRVAIFTDYQRVRNTQTSTDLTRGAPTFEALAASDPASSYQRYLAANVYDPAGALRFGLEERLNNINAQTINSANAVNNIQAEPRPAQGLEFSESKSAASIAYNGEVGEEYRFPDGTTWRVAEKREDQDTGFRAVVLRPNDPNDRRVIVAYAGTQDGKDWDDNIIQAGGGVPAQYRQAVELARDVRSRYGNENVHLTGHSLGGGLASYAAIRTGAPATAINSAALHNNNIPGRPGDHRNITQYYVNNEILTVLERGNLNDARPGQHITVPGRISQHWLASWTANPDDRTTWPEVWYENHGLNNTAPAAGLPVRVR